MSMMPQTRSREPPPGNTGACAELEVPSFLEALFDTMPDIAFFVKNSDGAYVVVNDTLVRRCGLRCKSDLIGHVPQDLFPSPLGERYAAQDRQVLAGRVIRERLELHLYPDGQRGWCVTHKLPLRRPDGRIVGIAGVSRDITRPDERHEDYRPLAAAIEHLQRHFGDALHVRDLARLAGMPEDRFRRLVRRIFHITPGQLMIKTRLEAAAHLLVTSDMTIAEVALACGYCDQSAFTRQFRMAVNVTPHRFRGRRVGPSGPERLRGQAD